MKQVHETYYRNHGSELRQFLESSAGRDLLVALTALRPQFPNRSTPPHLYADEAGQVNGWEKAMRSLLILSQAPKTPKQVEQDYGVERSPEPPKPETTLITANPKSET